MKVVLVYFKNNITANIREITSETLVKIIENNHMKIATISII